MPRASKSPRSRRPRWHWIITIKWDESNRFPEMVTASGTCVSPPGYTRQDMFDLLYERTVRQAKATDAYVSSAMVTWVVPPVSWSVIRTVGSAMILARRRSSRELVRV